MREVPEIKLLENVKSLNCVKQAKVETDQYPANSLKGKALVQKYNQLKIERKLTYINYWLRKLKVLYKRNKTPSVKNFSCLSYLLVVWMYIIYI